MIHHHNIVAEAFEKAIENAQEKIGMIDILAMAVTFYLTICVYAAVAL